MAEIVPVTSEALEAQIRDLLPSQRGFGEDLQASNVITPIIDLTAAAQGTTTPVSMQQALAFGSQTAFSAVNTTVTLANTPGFWRIFGVINSYSSTANAVAGQFDMSDGLSTKTITSVITAGAAGGNSIPYDFIVFLDTGESISAVSGASTVYVTGSYRQIADSSGNLINPSGFTPQ